jgi:hypothetical protein
MKTLTEFSAFQLREACSKSKEIRSALPTEGKTPEELTQAHQETLKAYLTEKYKLEGDRLELFLKALEVSESKPHELENLKRVVVYLVSEGEKIPGHLIQKETHAFGPEYLASLRPKKSDRRDRGSKFSKEKGKGRGKRRRDLRGKRPDGQDERRGANENSTAPAGKEGEDRRPRRPRRFGPRPPKKDLPPGHLSPEQAAQAARPSTGIRPIEKKPQPETT